jgi:DNA-binding NtrC family response regulator
VSERILVVDDEPVIRVNLAESLARAGYEVETAPDGAEALERVLDSDFAIVVSDIRMPRMDGVALLKRIVAERPDTFVLLTTAFASVDTAVEALRFGAYDYLLKPIGFEDLHQKIGHLLSYRALKQEVLRLRRSLPARLGFEGLVGESPRTREVFELVDRVAPTKSTVLITGESGTGKELVAHAVHARSALRDKEFLALNVAAIPSELAEAQLFGHEKGAFTGADRARDGILRAVRGGTVFFDEIGDLPLAAQAKLLRAIESRELMPVGADRPVSADFRLIAATHRDLAQLVADGRFRQDLYFRLNVFHIALPPLRERRDDIPALVEHFARRHAETMGKPPCSCSNETMRLLLAHHWPGNVRELSNIVERATILASSGVILPEHLPAELRREGARPTELRAAVEQFERDHISWVLHVAGGNREQAAQLLGVDVATLYRRLAKYGMH